MELYFAMLCQGAVQQGPLMTIVGAGFDNVGVPTLPANVSAAVAFSFWLDRDDVQRPHTVSVQFIDEDGQPMRGLDLPQLQLPPNPNVQIDPHIGHVGLNGILNLNGAQVHSAGRYAVDVRFDGDAVKRISTPHRAGEWARTSAAGATHASHDVEAATPVV